MTIAEWLARGKGLLTGPGEEGHIEKEELPSPRRLPQDLVLIAVLVLASGTSFGLGVVAGREGGAGEGKVRIDAAEVAVEAPAAVAEGSAGTPGEEPEPAKEAPAKAASGGSYVGSKTGTKYYLPWCGTAKRIKDENKVWFASKAEAETAGYEPAKNCKGL